MVGLVRDAVLCARAILAIALVSSAAAVFGVVFGSWIAIATLFGAIVATFAAVQRPGLLLAAYLLIPFYKGAIATAAPVDITVVLALLNLGQVIPVIRHRGSGRVSRVGLALWAAVGILMLGGTLYAPSQELALRSAVTYWALVVLPLLPAALRVGSEPRHVRDFLWTCFGMGAIVIVLGLAQLSSTTRLTVLGMNTIQTALAPILTVLISASFVIREGRRAIRTIAVVLIPLGLIVALASGSRGPVLALATLALLVAIRSVVLVRRVSRRRVAGLTSIALASIIIAIVVAPELPLNSLGRFASFGDTIQSSISGDPYALDADLSSQTRVALFGFALSMFQDRPILGAGTAGFMAVGPSDYPHNALLQVAAEFGLTGLILFIGLLLVALTRRLPAENASRTVRLLLWLVLVEAMVSGDIFSDRMTFGLLALVLTIPMAGSISPQQVVRESAGRPLQPRSHWEGSGKTTDLVGASASGRSA